MRVLPLLLVAAIVACDAGGTIPRLSAAARSGNLSAMERLLESGADPNELDRRSTRWPPLLHALHKNQLAAAQLLLDRGADPDGGTPNGYSALMMAILDHDLDAVDLLLEAGADPNRARHPGYTPLMMAAAQTSPEILERLLAAGANPGTAGPNGMTALTQAIGGGAINGLNGPSIGGCHPDNVRALLDAAPALTVPNSPAGTAALGWARLHDGIQKARNLAVVPTTGRAPVIACGQVLNLIRGRSPE